MSRRSTRTFRLWGYLASIVLLHVPPCGLAGGQATAPLSVADRLHAAIRHAETYDLLSVTEQGDLAASRAGLRELEGAERLLHQASLPPAEAARLKRHIEALRSDLQDRIEISRWTLEGVFPLAGFLTSSLFADSGPAAIYQLIDDPAIRATRKATDDLLARAVELEKKQVQLPVVVTCATADGVPDRLEAQRLEHAARQVFRGSPQFQAQTPAKVDEALLPAGDEVRDAFRTGDVTPAIAEQLRKAFKPKLLVVVIRQVDVVGDVCYYRVEGQFIEANSAADKDASTPRQEVFSTVGFGRDRRDRLAWFLWANAALLVIAYAAYALIVHTHRAMAGSSWTTLLVLPLVAFVVGRTLPYAVSPLLGSIRLPPATPALASFWVACLAGLGFLAAPLVAYWLASSWFATLWPSLSPANRGGALFAAMGAGIAAYLASPLLLYSENHPAIDVMLMSMSVIVLAYLLGRTLDYSDPLPLSLACVPLMLTMPAGAALLNADTTWLGIALALIIVSAAAVIAGNALHRKHRLGEVKSNVNRPLDDQAPVVGSRLPADLPGFISRAEKPDYQPFPAFDRAWDGMRPVLEGRCCYLALFGPRGAGKTATLAALETRLVQEAKKRGPAWLRGSCPQPISEPISYAPFREALAQHFEVNLLVPPGPKMQQISQALGGIFGSVIPFGRILFPNSAASGDAVARPDEINASIAWMLRRLSKTQPVLLVLDDVQWIDAASAALVKYLLAEFPAGGNTALGVILVADHKSCLADLGVDVAGCGIEIAYPSEAQQAQILVRGVGLQATAAGEVLARTGAARETDGGLLWPLQVVAKLARCGALVRSDEGFALANGAWPADFAIPNHMQAAIQEQWESAGQYHAILGCAACGSEGREFRVNVLTGALNRTRLDLLVVLDEIERTTGLIHDVRERDDVYAFHSSFLLEVIRGKLGIAGHGPRKTDVPQIVREYHARLAIALESVLETSRSKLYEVANHFYAAGERHAAKGVEYCLEAARDSAAGYDFRLAGKYLAMAGECAEFSAAGPLVEMEKQVIRCQEAQVASQGEQRSEAATAGLAYLKEHPAAPARLVLAVARLCYDVGHRSREPKWYDDAAWLCQQIAAHPASPTEEAEARHIMAVSQPSQRRAERIAGLRKAYALLEHVATEDRDASRWLAQIVNSLAKELSKGKSDEQSEAKRLFECRLLWDAQRQLGDLRGTAMAAAGLGRLELMAEPKDVAAAEKHFQRNLEISEAIGDVNAQVKMHSLLGACGLEKGDLAQALARYRRSWELAGDPIDRCFAAIGLLRCYQQQNRAEQFEGMAQQLLGVLQGEKVPPDCEGPLRAVLEACPAESRGEAVRKLADLARLTGKAVT